MAYARSSSNASTGSGRADGRLIRLPQEDCCQALSVPQPLKYQSDGGPGVRDLLALFKSSDEPERDIGLILRAPGGLLAHRYATDGLAQEKNFSLFLRPGGRFRMTPLYRRDERGASVAARPVDHRRQAKLAMSLGKEPALPARRDHARHLEQTAALADFDPRIVRDLYRELSATAEAAAAPPCRRGRK